MRYLVFVLLLTGLSGCGGTEGGSSWLTERPKSPADSDQLVCVIGDPGTGNENQLAVAKAMQVMNCDQVRVLGDVIYPSGIKSPQDRQLQTHFMQPYAELLANKVPFYMLMGNHDFKQNAAAWLEIAAGNPLIEFPNWYYAERWGDVCIFSLETTWYNKLYFIHKRHAQTSWLRRTMRELRPACRFTLALGHHPLMSSGKHGDANLAEALFLSDEVFGRVDMYIAGHDHYLSDEGEFRGTHQLVSGAGGKVSHLDGDEEEDEDHHEYGSEGSEFSLWEQGFVTLRFARENGRVVADYRFIAVDPANPTEPKEVWKGRVAGEGLRLDQADS